MTLKALIDDLVNRGYSYSAAFSIATAILKDERRTIAADLLAFHSLTRG